MRLSLPDGGVRSTHISISIPSRSRVGKLVAGFLGAVLLLTALLVSLLVVAVVAAVIVVAVISSVWFRWIARDPTRDGAAAAGWRVTSPHRRRLPDHRP